MCLITPNIKTCSGSVSVKCSSLASLLGEVAVSLFCQVHSERVWTLQDNYIYWDNNTLEQTYLQNKAEVSWGLVFALKVFAIVDIYIVKLDKADEVTGRLKRNKGLDYKLICSVFVGLFLFSCLRQTSLIYSKRLYCRYPAGSKSCIVSVALNKSVVQKAERLHTL